MTAMTAAGTSRTFPIACGAGALVAGALLGWWMTGELAPRRAGEIASAESPASSASPVSQAGDSVHGQLAALLAETSASRQFVLVASWSRPRSAAEARAWLARAERLPGSALREFAVALLLRDTPVLPYETLAASMSFADPQTAAHFAERWIGAHGPAALSQALDRSLPDALIFALAQAGARQDPQALWAQLQDRPFNESLRQAMSGLFTTWLAAAPDEAASRFFALPAPRQNELRYTFILAWTEQDPAQALAWVLQHPPADRDLYVSAIIGQWGIHDPAAAAAAMMTHASDLLHRNVTLGISIWGVWADRDPEGLLTWLDAQPGLPAGSWHWARGEVAMARAGTDPDAAWELAKESPPPLRRSSVSRIANTLIERDPARAIDWFRELTDVADREAFLSALQSRANAERLTPGARERFLSSLPDHDPTAAAAKVQLMAGDPEAVSSYWRSLSADIRHELVRSQAFAQVINQAPATAAELYLEQIRQSAQAEDAAGRDDSLFKGLFFHGHYRQGSQLALSLAATDPSAAERWIAALPALDAALATEVASNYAANLGRFDRARLDTWLDSLPADSPIGHGLLRGLARLELTLHDPAAALALTERLPANSPYRNDALTDVFRVWKRLDSAAAEEKLATLPLTDAQKNELRSRLGR